MSTWGHGGAPTDIRLRIAALECSFISFSSH